MSLMENKEQPKLLSVRLADLERKFKILDKKFNALILKHSGRK